MAPAVLPRPVRAAISRRRAKRPSGRAVERPWCAAWLRPIDAGRESSPALPSASTPTRPETQKAPRSPPEPSHRVAGTRPAKPWWPAGQWPAV